MWFQGKAGNIYTSIESNEHSLILVFYENFVLIRKHTDSSILVITEFDNTEILSLRYLEILHLLFSDFSEAKLSKDSHLFITTKFLNLKISRANVRF